MRWERPGSSKALGGLWGRGGLGAFGHGFGMFGFLCFIWALFQLQVLLV